MQYDKVVDLIAATKKAGAKFLTGGEVLPGFTAKLADIFVGE